jgi:hypothetical protein
MRPHLCEDLGRELTRCQTVTPPASQPYLKQAELDKAEYDTLRKQYEEDAAARSRGETVPEREHVEPSYAKETVSPRLLAAVLPKTFDERMAGGEVPIDNTLNADLLAETMHTEGDQSMERGDDQVKVEVEHAMDAVAASGDMMTDLVLPEGLDFTANFDLAEAASGAEDANAAFDFQTQALANHLQQPKLEDVSVAPVNGQHDQQVKYEAVSAATVNIQGVSTTTIQEAVVAAAVTEVPVAAAAETLQPTEVQAPVEEDSTFAPKVEEVPAEQPSDEARDDVPVSEEEANEESTTGVDTSPAAEDDPAAPVREMQRSPTPEPDPAKIEAAAEMGVTTEAELAEDAAEADIPPSIEDRPRSEVTSAVVDEPATDSQEASVSIEEPEVVEEPEVPGSTQTQETTETIEATEPPEVTETPQDPVVAEG